jgi:hypothetical protein
LAGFNVLANYWFNRDESLARHPYVALLNLAFVLFEQMPGQHRKAWRALYDHYVFQLGGNPMNALAPSHRDCGRTIDPSALQKFKELLRALLSNTVDDNGDDS